VNFRTIYGNFYTYRASFLRTIYFSFPDLLWSSYSTVPTLPAFSAQLEFGLSSPEAHRGLRLPLCGSRLSVGRNLPSLKLKRLVSEE